MRSFFIKQGFMNRSSTYQGSIRVNIGAPSHLSKLRLIKALAYRLLYYASCHLVSLLHGQCVNARPNMHQSASSQPHRSCYHPPALHDHVGEGWPPPPRQAFKLACCFFEAAYCPLACTINAKRGPVCVCVCVGGHVTRHAPNLLAFVCVCHGTARLSYWCLFLCQTCVNVFI